MKFISAKDVADKWGISKRRVLKLCNEGRIAGAQLVGNSWIIPSNITKPKDQRFENKKSSSQLDLHIYPIQSSVKAKRHTPQYTMHKYFARRPYNVFNNLISHYSNEGDIVLDPFCGGGVTVFESAALGRKPIGVDINPLATLITRMQMFDGNTDELKNYYQIFIDSISKKYMDWYFVSFPDDQGIASWFEWAYKVNCPLCNSEIILNTKSKVNNGYYRCPNIKCVGYKKGVSRIQCEPNGLAPLRVKYTSSKTGKFVTRNFSLDNIPSTLSQEIRTQLDMVSYKPNFTIPNNWDRQHEDKLKEKGVLEYSDFFTLRNYVLNCLIFNEIMDLKTKVDSKLNEYLYFLFSSSLRYTNKMARVTDNWEGGNPTAMDKHAFWLPNQFVETNIIDILKKRAKVILKGFSYSSNKLHENLFEVSNFEDFKLHDSYLVSNYSSTNLLIPDESIDTIVTDPPYGSNVQYAELSIIWNTWYSYYIGDGSYINNEEEAVVNRRNTATNSKNIDEYERLLYEVFKECNRVLKPNRYLVFTFNNKNLKVWIAMLKAVTKAGFYLPKEGVIFQDYIDSYKNTSHLRFSGNIQGDFIYSFMKGFPEINNKLDKDLNLSSIVDSSINKTINSLFKENESLTTPYLYQHIMSDLSSQLMEYIQIKILNNSNIEDISHLNNDYLETKLKQVLMNHEGKWWQK